MFGRWWVARAELDGRWVGPGVAGNQPGRCGVGRQEPRVSSGLMIVWSPSAAALLVLLLAGLATEDRSGWGFEADWLGAGSFDWTSFSFPFPLRSSD